MDTVTWQGLSKLLRLALMGIGVAVAAFIVSVLLGLSAQTAQAADGEEPGLLGAVTGLLDDTTSAVGDTVGEVTNVATEVVTAVVPVAPAPVQQQQVVETVGDTVGQVVAPVQEVVSNDVVTTVTTPVVEVVTAVPVVGDVVSGIGLDTALTDIAADVDETLTQVVGTLADAGETLAPPAVPPAPVDTPTVSVPQDFAAAPVTTVVATTPAALSPMRPAEFAAQPSFDAGAIVATLAVAAVSAVDTHQLQTSMGALSLSIITSAGPGGAGLGVWALAALLPFVAHRAWVRRAGPENEPVPSSPAGSTDVSPD